jgi:KAP family P-loop domain
MWSTPSFDPSERPAENAVLEAVSNVVVKHLRKAESASEDRDTPPVLIQVDGPGRTQLLRRLEYKLDPVAPGAAPAGSASTAANGKPSRPPWTAVSFDAWKYQRLAPPWWWLMSALDKRIRARSKRLSPWQWLLQRSQDVGWRLMRLALDLRWVLPGALLVLLGWLLWKETMVPALGWLMGATGSIAALVAFLTSIGNALRRHLLAESPRGTNALLRSSDPMEDLLHRYSFLVRSAGTPIIVLIDNLDRCRAEYVVEMLEGIQTLLRNPRGAKRWSLGRRSPTERCPFIAFVVAADRSWLCDSYRHVYTEFESTTREPGRPFGLVFLDKIFDVALRVPTVPAAAGPNTAARNDGRSDPDPFDNCVDEPQVRVALRAAEQARAPGDDYSDEAPPPPVPVLRRRAVMRLAEIELGSSDSAPRSPRRDTAMQLDQLLAELDPGPAVQRQLATAYCVQRSTQLLAGHAVDSGSDAIHRLALWTILDLKWPLLTSYLRRRPQDLEHLGKETAPPGIDADLALVLPDPVARRLADGPLGVNLRAKDIVRFTEPLRPGSAGGHSTCDSKPQSQEDLRIAM